LPADREAQDAEVAATEVSKDPPGDRVHRRLETVEQVSKIISALAIPIVLAVVGATIQERIGERSLSKDYVTLAVSILQNSKPSDSNDLLRDWAVRLISSNSPISFPEELKDQLKSGSVVISTEKLVSSATSRSGRLYAVVVGGDVVVLDRFRALERVAIIPQKTTGSYDDPKLLTFTDDERELQAQYPNGSWVRVIIPEMPKSVP
jgi:hypothetical protein